MVAESMRLDENGKRHVPWSPSLISVSVIVVVLSRGLGAEVGDGKWVDGALILSMRMESRGQDVPCRVGRVRDESVWCEEGGTAQSWEGLR